MADSPKGRPRLVSIDEAAAHYGVSPFTIRRGVWDHKIPHMRVGRLIRIDLDALDEQFRAAAADDNAAGLSLTRPRRAPRP